MTVPLRRSGKWSKGRRPDPGTLAVNNHAANVVLTIGHSTRTLEDFIALLKENRVTMVIDVRTVPRSRHNPQFNIDSLPVSLLASHIGYKHLAGLGGLRHPRPDSPNTAWRNASFRGFADYMLTEEFEKNLAVLSDLARRETIALMCAEAVPWRCHRSLIADALSVRGLTVEHIMGRSTRRAHVRTPWSQVRDGRITYRLNRAEP